MRETRVSLCSFSEKEAASAFLSMTVGNTCKCGISLDSSELKKIKKEDGINWMLTNKTF